MEPTTADLEIYKMVTQHFQQDVREFWVRSNFYLLVQAGLLSVFVGIFSHSSIYRIVSNFVLGFLGFIIAVMWFLVARGSILWLRRWREQVIELDKIVDRHQCYSKVEAFAIQCPIMSPSNITQYLPIVFAVAWAVLIVVLFFYP